MSGQNYARGIPMGNNQMPASYDAPPAVKASGVFYTENAVNSSVVTFSANATAIELTNSNNTANRAVLMRWVPASDTQASVTTANYDHAVPVNTTRRFVIPIEVNNPQGYSSQVGANIENGLFRRVAFMSLAAASVIGNEYGSSNSY